MPPELQNQTYWINGRDVSSGGPLEPLGPLRSTPTLRLNPLLRTLTHLLRPLTPHRCPSARSTGSSTKAGPTTTRRSSAPTSPVASAAPHTAAASRAPCTSSPSPWTCELATTAADPQFKQAQPCACKNEGPARWEAPAVTNELLAVGKPGHSKTTRPPHCPGSFKSWAPETCIRPGSSWPSWSGPSPSL